MNYVNLYEVQDSFLSVTERDIEQANLYVGSIARQKGVKEEDIIIPIGFNVKRLAILFACYNNCLSSVGTDATTTFDGGNRADIYADKLKLYKDEIDKIEGKLTKADFVGQNNGGATISLWRG